MKSTEKIQDEERKIKKTGPELIDPRQNQKAWVFDVARTETLCPLPGCREQSGYRPRTDLA